jgi:DNA-cytosine methyltransferase
MINVLSLFDGMSCGRIALNKLDIPCKYYASEIDKYAIKVSQANYPDTIQLGDVTQVYWKDKKLHKHLQPKIDLLIGGSPCQGFSFAGKHLNFEDKRSKLFFEYVRLLNEVKPKYFLLENVRMKKESEDIISQYLGVSPIAINSNTVSAQNRQRLYWTNIPVSQPEDKGIKLKDILEDGLVDRDKSHCLDANYWKGGNLKSYFEKHRRQLVFSSNGLCHVGEADIKGNDNLKRVYHPDGKAPTLTTMQGGNQEPKVFIVQRPRGANEGGIKATNGKTPTLSSCSWEQNNFLVHADDLKWRKLTPLECERLQTVPDNYTNHVSNTQRYKMLGNGMTVDVITHILKGMKL